MKKIKINLDTAIIIELEDKGQDFLKIIVDTEGFVLQTWPFQTSLWKGAYIPIKSVKVGKPCPIHHPPHIQFGFLNYKVMSIKKSK
jgi:hypothetical protein